MLRYSDAALAVRPTFFAQCADIIVIVEDMGKENFYTQVLNHLLKGKAKVYKVLGVGGKTQVIRRFEARRKKPAPVEFYLIDGDFDELLERACPIDSKFYRLQRYDIESYLVEKWLFARSLKKRLLGKSHMNTGSCYHSGVGRLKLLRRRFVWWRAPRCWRIGMIKGSV